MRSSLPSALIAFAVAACAAGCSCEPTGFDKRSYACASNADCLTGHACVAGVCSTSTVGGGAATGGGMGGSNGGGSNGGGANGGGVTGGGGGTCADLPETCGDDVDDNCNGILDDGCTCSVDRGCYPDRQNVFSPRLDSPQLRYPWDGGAGCTAGVQQCVDGKFAQTCVGAVTPIAEACDGRDNDCDGVIDLNCPCQPGRECFPGAPNTNGVGVCHAGLWNCALPAGQQCVGVNVGGVETCNGLDDDCNGLVDDNPSQTSACAPGVCSGEFRACDGGVEVACNLTTIPGYSALDTCGDQQDNNCNGSVDEGCTCSSGAMQGCYTGPASACDGGGGCYGICRRGTQTCGTISDGGLGFGACAGEVLPAAEACADALDNDCDNLVDCADSQCSNRPCGGGRTCFGGSCQCIFDGGVSTVEICTDGVDNTCNALTDCAEASCSGQTCGTFGKRCVGTSCQCVIDGGVAEPSELTCGDGRDNDCDGLVDCADSTCAARACATARTCILGVCTCLTDGGVPQATEAACSDGVDNDCDGLTDCADPNCAAACVPAENCKDNADNDGDMLIDCADPDCNHKGCSASSGASVCCGTTCINLGTDPNNCGVCGAVCPSGACQATTENGKQSGRCTCPSGTSTQCPMPGPTRQTCNATLCSCADDNDQCDGLTSNCGDHLCSYP